MLLFFFPPVPESSWDLQDEGGIDGRGEGVLIRRNIADPTAMWLDLSPSSLLPLVLADPGFAYQADPGFAYQKPKLPLLRVWCPYSEKSGLCQALL